MRAAYLNCSVLAAGRAFLRLSTPALLFEPAAFKRRRGQNTVEYLLMLAVVASMAVIMVILFHKKLLGGIFTLAGLIIGAGTPK
ncbi:MAG: hypothetical protein A2234_11365 [Elusimicrobia bacterium RIFOXYA2_FULL_58_8]|nr:MAG: hypothetical protein A2285_00740 [Elusimicrobia bacterium RIFOXYA12_FULL_57_11]OGS14495.1 MAG: hypothetical protein A2234_11365 [Elusimicrobia bacterium RIFOXYA2_FULL_58_8]